MSEPQIEVIDKEFTGTCHSKWGHNECPNIAEWHLVNTTNNGNAYMCTLHKLGFHLAFPDAKVTYHKLSNEVA